MQSLPRTETFKSRFNLSFKSLKEASPARPKKERQPLPNRIVWWAFLLFVSVLPAYIVVATDLPTAWANIDEAVKRVLDFPKTHKIRLPGATETEGRLRRAFEETNADLVAWHLDMSRLQQLVAEDTPIGAVQDSTLEFVFSSPSKSPAREWRAASVSAYILLAVSLYFVDSVHIAIVLFQFNILEFSLAIEIKRLDDALEKTLEHLSARHMELAMMPLEDDAVAIGQQLVCLQKMQIFYNIWNQVNLGQNIRIPFRKDFVNLNLSLVFSIVAAVFLRTVEVLLLAVWPNLPRFNISHRMYSWLRRALLEGRLRQAPDQSLYNAPSSLAGQPSQPTSLDLLFRQNSESSEANPMPTYGHSVFEGSLPTNRLSRRDSLAKRLDPSGDLDVVEEKVASDRG